MLILTIKFLMCFTLQYFSIRLVQIKPCSRLCIYQSTKSSALLIFLQKTGCSFEMMYSRGAFAHHFASTKNRPRLSEAWRLRMSGNAWESFPHFRPVCSPARCKGRSCQRLWEHQRLCFQPLLRPGRGHSFSSVFTHGFSHFPDDSCFLPNLIRPLQGFYLEGKSKDTVADSAGITSVGITSVSHHAWPILPIFKCI
ncbi:uncharacterized protein [Symphalangus syndactylus]|uniref:uncharacterized protein isoform X3 n=1 Tax=Symphalangus syndactylus TaxID=9590 RepID=UPI003006EAB5